MNERELYPLLDMHGQHVAYIDQPEVNRLRSLGVVSSYGTKKKIHGYRLTLSLSRVAGYEFSDRALVPANYAGTRYVYRDKFSELCAPGYRLKRLHETDSSVYGLLRILRAPALEHAEYIPRMEATDEQRAKDPGKERRTKVAALFQAVPIHTQAANRRHENVVEFPAQRRPITLLPLAA